MTFTAFPRVGGVHPPAVEALQRFGYDRQTGIIGTAMTLANAPVAGTLALFKNGALLDEATAYSVSKTSVTLGVAAIAGDVFQAYYHYQQAR